MKAKKRVRVDRDLEMLKKLLLTDPVTGTRIRIISVPIMNTDETYSFLVKNSRNGVVWKHTIGTVEHKAD